MSKCTAEELKGLREWVMKGDRKEIADFVITLQKQFDEVNDGYLEICKEAGINIDALREH